MKKCIYCFNDLYYKIDIFHYFYHKDVLCGQCRRKLKKYKRTFYLDTLKVTTLYEYDSYMESLLFQFKEGKDIALKDIFFLEYKKYIEKTYKDYTIVYMPSGKEKNKERGFIALEEMLQSINLKKMHCLYKKREIKQSSQPYSERKKIIDNIGMLENVQGKILLVDDVITSGSTLLGAYQWYKNKEVEALVLCDNTHIKTKKQRKKLTIF